MNKDRNIFWAGIAVLPIALTAACAAYAINSVYQSEDSSVLKGAKSVKTEIGYPQRGEVAKLDARGLSEIAVPTVSGDRVVEYDGNIHSLTVSGFDRNYMDYEIISDGANGMAEFDGFIFSAQNAGTYVLKFNLIYPEENVWADGGETEVSLTINRKVLRFDELLPRGEVYNGDEHDVLQQINVIDGVLQKGIDYIVEINGEDMNPVNAGTYTVSLLLLSIEADNYVCEPSSADFTVERAKLTVSLSATVIYGEELNADNVDVKYLSGRAGRDNVGVLAAEAKSVVNKFATDYVRGVTGAGSGKAKVYVEGTRDITNYTVTYTEGDVKVEKREIAAVLEHDSERYDGTEHKPLAPLEGVCGAMLAENYDYRVKYNDGYGLPVAVGLYTVCVELLASAAENYFCNSSFVYEIEPAEIGVSFGDGNFARAQTLIYDPSGKAYKLKLPEQGGEGFPLTVMGNNKVTVKYIAVARDEDEAEDFSAHLAGYLGELKSSFGKGSHLFGGFGDGKEYEWTEYGEDIRELNVKEPKCYFVFFLAEAPNHLACIDYFLVHIQRGTVVFHLKADVYDAPMATFEYGDFARTAEQFYDFIYENMDWIEVGGNVLDGRLDDNLYGFELLDGDDVKFLPAGPQSEILPVGTYHIKPLCTVSGSGAENVNFVWDNGEPYIQIVPREITVRLSAKGHEYGSQPDANWLSVTAKRTGKFAGDPSEWYAGGESDELNALGITHCFPGYGDVKVPDADMKAGVYKIDSDWTDKNYYVTFTGGEYIVSPKKLQVGLNVPNNLVYNDVGEFTADFYGVIGDDDVKVLLIYSGTANDGSVFDRSATPPALAGEYSVQPTLEGNDAINYEIAGADEYSYVISKAVYDTRGIIMNDASVKENGSLHSLHIDGELPYGVTVRYEGNGKSDPGIYEVTAYLEGDHYNYEPAGILRAKLNILRARLISADPENGTVIAYVENETGFAPQLSLVAEEDLAMRGLMEKSGIMGKNEKVAAAYGLKITEDGAETALSQKFAVRILIPVSLRSENFNLYSIDGNDQIYAIPRESYIEDGDYISFETDNLSSYAFTLAENNEINQLRGVVAVALTVGISIVVAGAVIIKRNKIKL